MGKKFLSILVIIFVWVLAFSLTSLALVATIILVTDQKYLYGWWFGIGFIGMAIMTMFVVTETIPEKENGRE